MRSQGKLVDLDIEALHFSVSDCTTLAFVFLIGFEIRMQPLKLKVPPRVVTIVHFIQASKLIEMVPNVIGLVIVPSVLVVNELYIPWKQKRHHLDKDTRRQTLQ